MTGEATLFETGTDPFGRPVAWATIERTGEQLDMLALAVAAPAFATGERITVRDSDGTTWPGTIVRVERTHALVTLDGHGTRELAYGLADIRAEVTS